MKDPNLLDTEHVSLLTLNPHPPIFQPLDASTRQIRLIRLLPSGWSDELIRSSAWAAELPKVEIECSLHVVSPEDKVYKSYNALSYAWGDITTQSVA